MNAVQEKALSKVMGVLNLTNNDVNRFVADAVAEYDLLKADNAALRAEVERLRARSEALERDLCVERGCLSCVYMDDDCPADCDKLGSRWEWRGPDGPVRQDAGQITKCGELSQRS